ncbi:DUF2207 domain-containing protein [Agromyces sp. NPDC057865]|uniref:DUF2207 domain-containing protein n=1 Tax=Agromyces sp. NPDC057865 TaxID=3346267 RepID=UPI003670EBE6
MLRPLARAAAAAVVAAVLVAAPALAASGATRSAPGGTSETAPAAQAAHAASAPVTAVPAGVDDFTFASFDAVFELGRDAAKRSVLDTTETLVAVFPEFDQNRGIRRAIPLDYDGHPTDIRVESVTDGDGTPRSYEVEEDENGEFLLVTIAADDYVHGEQTYVIRYHQQNVTLQPDDAPIDEFYWDVNGTGWAQPFGRVRAEVRMSPDVAAGLNGDTACYRGWQGSGTACESLTTTETDPPAVIAEAAALGPYENLTVAIGFEQGTFAPRDNSFGASPAAIAGAVAAGLTGLALLAAIALRATRWRNHPGRGTIIAQYEPPEGVSAMVAADLVGHPEKGVTATILERAVDGELRVVETGRKKYAVEFVGGEPGDAHARSVVSALFRGNPVPGASRQLKSSDTALGRRLLSIRQAVTKGVVRSGLRRKPDPGLRVLLAIGAISAATLSVVLGIFAIDDRRGGPWPAILFIVAIVAALATVVLVGNVRPLTERGREFRDHLEGLRLYIRLAEADRLRVLQSPSGALRVERPSAASLAASTTGATDAATTTATATSAAALDPAVVLKLNERLLPYAVLFGLEREWSRVLADLYEARGEEPTWYSGRSGFDAGSFGVAVSSFSTASSTSWSGSSSSSSSSGSSGGGSSGGGGGGGGGGGV